MRNRIALVACSWLSASACAAIDLSDVTAPIGEYVVSRPSVDGAGLLIVDFDGRVLWEQHWEGFDRHRVIRIASATKWLSGAAVMTSVDRGELSLDTAAGELLPEFAARGDGAADMTVRQMFGHTSGLTADSRFASDPTISLEQSARRIGLFEPMESAPGAEFRYGGASMQVAGRMAEVAAGASWEDLFQDRLMGPLGIIDTDFQGLGPTTNPRVAGGARSSLASYERFLRMLVDGGVYGGERVLSEEAAAELLADQTGAATLVSAPPTLNDYQGYGVGNWVFRRDADGRPVEFASPGAFGTTPWIDFENRYYGLFFVDGWLQDVAPLVDAVRAATREALSRPGDYNLDGKIDAADYEAWRNAFGSLGPTRADGNGDGLIDAADYVVWRDAAAASARAVPGPAPYVLALNACLAARLNAGRGRR